MKVGWMWDGCGIDVGWMWDERLMDVGCMRDDCGHNFVWLFWRKLDFVVLIILYKLLTLLFRLFIKKII